MADISLTFKYELENGEYGKITLKDISENATEADMQALVALIIEKNSKLKGQSIVKLVECVKSTLVQEQIDL